MEIAQRIATKAFMVNDGKVFILRESGSYVEGTNEGRWDFPGGRLNSGENFIEALKREVLEESGLEIEVGKPIYVGEWRPTIKGVLTQIVGIFFLCTPKTMEVKLSRDHDEFRWILPNEYENYDLVSPNGEVFEEYMERQGGH